MKFARRLMPVLALSTLAFGATPAMADAVMLSTGNVGTSFTVDFNGSSDGFTIDGLSSSITFTLQSASATSYTFSYSTTNNASATIGSRLTGFAFNTDPNITNANASGQYAYTTVGGNYPNGIGTLDVCFKDAATGSCAGGGSGGLSTGLTGTGSLTLEFASATPQLSISDFYVRYQSITGYAGVDSATGSGTLRPGGGGTSGGGSSGGTQVPEPGMLGLIGSAAGFVVLRRRRRKPAND